MVDSVLLELAEVTAADLPEQRWGDWFLTQVGTALDTTMLQAMRFVVDAMLMPRPEDLPQLRASAEPFINGELAHEPRQFFSFIDEPAVPLGVVDRHRRAISGGTVIARKFATDYRAHPASNDFTEPRAVGEDRVLVEHWVHDVRKPRGTVVALHGFSMGYPRMDAFAMFAAPFFRHGYDVALVTLPFHGPRTPADARFSGERFAVPHVARLNEAVRQAIYEIHMLIDWVRAETNAPVGLLGLSLGGYLSALMAGLRGDLDFVIPMVPPVCMGDLAWRFFAQSRRHRTGGAALSRDELRAAYRVHSPLTYACRVDRERLLILAGRGDQIVPADHPHALWRHWNEPDIHWFGGSHLAPFRRGQLFTTLLDHVERCTFDSR